jgi:uncharacterized membrane protein
MTNKNFSFGEAFGAGWAKLKEHWVFLIGAYLLLFVVSGLFSYLSDGPYRDIQPTGGLLALIGIFFRIWLNFNFLVIVIRLFDGVKPEWSDLFVWREETLSYVGASILYGLMVVLGCLLLIIPGIYFAIKYCFYGFLIADKKLGAIDALKMSGQMTAGVKWLLVGFGFATFGIILLGALALGIGLFVALPVVSLALVFVYRSLYDQTFDLATASAGTIVTTTPVAEKTELPKTDATSPTP